MSTDYDSRWDEAEAEVSRAKNWKFREPDAPNPLTILVTGWSTGVTKLGEAEWLNGTDRDGQHWSVLVGSKILTKALIDGVFEEWSDDEKRFVVVKTIGRTKPNEVVSIFYKGDREGAVYTYPDFQVSRKPALAPEPAESTEASPSSSEDGDGIPF